MDDLSGLATGSLCVCVCVCVRVYVSAVKIIPHLQYYLLIIYFSNSDKILWIY